MESYPKTIICDIDGTILYHYGSLDRVILLPPSLLPGVLEKFNEWNSKGYYIIFLTGRKESMRELTIKQLNSLGLYYDVLIMGAPRGERVIINDTKPDGSITARAVPLERNKGLNTEDI
jgi:phosphoglycolate phosphatase-like HAD superfamily hydrolase